MDDELERDQPALEQFVDFLQQAGAARITTDLAVQWARIPATDLLPTRQPRTVSY